jgi:hypothetical protein
MEITAEQYEKIKDSLPIQRGNVILQNLEVLNPSCSLPGKAANGAGFRLGLANGTVFTRA